MKIKIKAIAKDDPPELTGIIKPSKPGDIKAYEEFGKVFMGYIRGEGVGAKGTYAQYQKLSKPYCHLNTAMWCRENPNSEARVLMLILNGKPVLVHSIVANHAGIIADIYRGKFERGLYVNNGWPHTVMYSYRVKDLVTAAFSKKPLSSVPSDI